MAPPDANIEPAAALGRLARQPGAEPIPGYRLIEPLGSGGFGEVWKCEAPGGFFKAVKFVAGDSVHGGGPAAQERDALRRIKAIRHPYLLSLERVEFIDGMLVLVMELADRNLQSVLFDYHRQGLPGVPRKQLLGFLKEAAEALDVINFDHGLQHLDVKPHNLFVVSSHIKVADFGLVHRLPGPDGAISSARNGGTTPLYASPETLAGSLSPNSDQYSLAIVYQQLLTGTVPFWSASPYQLVQQHLYGSPDLGALPPEDQRIVARALAKAPEKRFPSCTEFVKALLAVEEAGWAGGQPARSPPRPGLAAPTVAATPAGEPPHRSAAHNQPTVRTITPGLAPAPAIVHHDGAKPPQRPTPTVLPVQEPPPTPDPIQLPQPAGVLAPGYCFLTSLGPTPLGHLWTVQDPEGRERLGHCIVEGSGSDPRLLERFESLRHPGLGRCEVVRARSGAVVLVSDLGRTTLRDRFDKCRAQGLQGVPRDDLLAYLEEAAEVLDEVQDEHDLPHLGLSPGNMLLGGDRVQLGDYGVASLFWVGAGRPVAQLGSRYAAPELRDPVASQTADQYSLALIYAELLTGVFPRFKPAGSKSGAYGRPPLPKGGSGTHRRAVGPNQGSGLHRRADLAANGPGAVDLDLLPVGDRAVVARALHENPRERFPSCTSFIQALDAATPAPAHLNGVADLPQVVPFARLMGSPTPAADDAVPLAEEVTARLIATVASGIDVVEQDALRCLVHPDGSREYRFPVQIVPVLLRLKLQGFGDQWKAQLVREEPQLFVFRLQTSEAKRFWSRAKATTAGLEIEVRLHRPEASESARREVVVRVQAYGDEKVQPPSVAEMGPRLVQSLRAFLQAHPEQRSQERWPFTQSVSLYPVLPDQSLAKTLEARGRDVSRGGACVLTPQRPPCEFAYFHFHDTPGTAPLALLGRIVRVQTLDDDLFELGVTFAVDGPPRDTGL